MKSYKYLLFDWDGCLAMTLQLWMDAYREVFAKKNIFPTEQEIAFHFGDWELPKYFGIKDIEGCLDEVDKIAGVKLRKVDLYPSVKEVLTSLKTGNKKKALLSSSPRDIVKDALLFHHLEDYFDVVLCGEDVTKHKPDPEVIEKGLSLLNGEKEGAIIIGDSRKDLEAATNAGIDSLLFYPQENSLFYKLEDLKKYKPTYIINNFSEALGLLV